MATTPDATMPDDGSFRRGPDSRGDSSSQGGAVLFRRYRLQRELGRGGMGIVMLAHDTALDILVAVKLVPDMVVKDTEAIADLRKEVLRGMALMHPNIVRTHNFERDEQTAGVIMEYVEGETLADLKHHQPCGCFAHHEILPWIEQVCSVLEYAHTDARIIHRDLKPRNLILNKAGKLKVADFGISASLNDSRSRQSVEGATSGTPSYMSPQQAEGRRPSTADDIHALGATIYELLTGKPPFFRGNATAIYGQILSVVPPRMAERREELEVSGKPPIPETWEEVIASCLAKDPAARPAKAGDILTRLKAAVNEAPPAPPAAAVTPVTPVPDRPATSPVAPPPAITPGPVTSADPSAQEGMATVRGKSGTNPMILVAAGIGVLGIGTALLMTAQSNKREDRVAKVEPTPSPVIAATPAPAPVATPEPALVAVVATPAPPPPEPIPVTTPPRATPEPKLVAALPKDAIQHVIQGYTRALSSDAPPEVGQFLAERIDYEKLGTVARASVVRDVAYDARNWPERKYTIETTPTIRTRSDTSAEAQYVANYEVHNAKGVSYGRMEMTVVFDTTDPAKPRITSVKSKVLNARKNQKSDKKP